MLREAIARRLEEGSLRGAWALAASRGWELVAGRKVARELRIESSSAREWRGRVITVGGATLGGSGCTPLVLACAVHCARTGARVAIVGHAYGAKPRIARWVQPSDSVRVVGDEALACARRVSGLSIGVAVAPTREQAFDLARGADVVVLDGPVQVSPRRASLALLAVDAQRPWGARRCPPAGDLRFPIHALLEAADRIVTVGDQVEPTDALGCVPPDRLRWARIHSAGARVGERCLGWSELRSLRVGLVLATARPQRIIRWLERHAVTPRATITSGDHRPLAGRAQRRVRAAADDVDLWLCTEKCAAHLGPVLAGRPVGALDFTLELSPELASELG